MPCPRPFLVGVVALALTTGLRLHAQAPALTPYEQVRQHQARRAAHAQPTTTATPFAAGGPQRVSGGQVMSALGMPNFASVMHDLRSAGMGMIKGCDYQRYLNLVDGMGGAISAIQSLVNWRPNKRYGVPFTDYVSAFLKMGGVNASKKSAAAETNALIYNLEQVCNAVVQADEINRQYQIIQAGSFNIGHALNWLQNNVRLTISKVPGSNKQHVTANWAQVYNDGLPPSGTERDTLWDHASQVMEQTLEASAANDSALDRLEEELRQAEEDLILYAEWDSQAKTWTCPEGYPDPNRPDVTMHNNKRVCGPASPERSTQVMARVELLKTQIKALSVASESRGLEVDAIRLATDNQERRTRAYTQATGNLVY